MIYFWKGHCQKGMHRDLSFETISKEIDEHN